MPWNIDPLHLLGAVFTLFIVPAITGFIASKFGVRRALEQARRERAFDRSIEWHESTLRVISEFQILNKKFEHFGVRPDIMTLAKALGRGEVGAPALESEHEGVQKIAAALRESALKLEEAIFKAFLFADAQTIKSLRSTTEIIERVSFHADRVVESRGDLVGLWYESQRLDSAVRHIRWELADSLRKQLGLNKLSSTDLGFGPEPSRLSWLLLRHPALIRLLGKLPPRTASRLLEWIFGKQAKKATATGS
jgi:hypothetical protein